ncbi:MAG: hypothetical protein OYH77_06565 [Pseudomonadota bacterium]|nr:hypothetical protein [Pseudomonadota bacterium]
MHWPWDTLITIWRDHSLEDQKNIASWLIKEAEKLELPASSDRHKHVDILEQAKSYAAEVCSPSSGDLAEAGGSNAVAIEQLMVATFKILLLCDKNPALERVKSSIESKLQPAVGGWELLRSWWQGLPPEAENIITTWMKEHIDKLGKTNLDQVYSKGYTVRKILAHAQDYYEQISTEDAKGKQLLTEQLAIYLTSLIPIFFKAKKDKEKQVKVDKNHQDPEIEKILKQIADDRSDAVKADKEQTKISLKQTEISQWLMWATIVIAIGTIFEPIFPKLTEFCSWFLLTDSFIYCKIVCPIIVPIAGGLLLLALIQFYRCRVSRP